MMNEFNEAGRYALRAILRREILRESPRWAFFAVLNMPGAQD